MEKTVGWVKEGGDENSKLVADLPCPPDEISGYLILKDYTFLAKDDFRKPDGCYVEGKIVGSGGEWRHFEPLSEIINAESPASDLMPSDQGWLELASGRTHSMKEAISPMKPYVEGWWDAKGYFHPRPLKINR